MRIEVTGASDDLIEVDGDISEEFAAYDGPGNYLAFSDGTVLRIVYDQDGIWRVSRVISGTAEYQHESGDLLSYTSDVAVIEGTIRWVMHGEEIVTAQ
jgi:hypothetical protein